MPLSEHEQRLLDQIERALYQEDPKFASTVRATDLRTHMRRRLRRAGLVLALGFLLLLTGVVISKAAIGIAGFVVMVGALLLAMSSWKRLGQPGSSNGGSNPGLHVAGGSSRRVERPTRTKPNRPAGGGSSGSFMAKLEQRWKRRWEERGREGRCRSPTSPTQPDAPRPARRTTTAPRQADPPALDQLVRGSARDTRPCRVPMHDPDDHL